MTNSHLFQLLSISDNQNLTGFRTAAIDTSDCKDTTQSTRRNLPEDLRNARHCTGTISADKAGKLTSFSAGRFKEKEGSGNGAIKGCPNNYPGIKLDSSINYGQRLAILR
ncbi:MAG: hypothetical protein ACOX3D_12030 [Syntrophomonadales bacterium]